jgi:hypothetical protein
MNGIAWPLVGLASKLLDRDEREVVLGDLLETDESAWRGFLDVFGLYFRRQGGLWKESRPWFAAFVVALPCSYLLMYVSISVRCTFERLVHHKVYGWHWPTGHEGFGLLLCHIFLLVTWSWSTGYIAGSVSRRTLWVSGALSLFPSLLCLPMHRAASLPWFCLFLFLPPAVMGAIQGLCSARVSLGSASLLAVMTSALMILAWSNHALWNLNWILIWPSWYLVATAWRSGSGSRSGSFGIASSHA